jgi:hypothetical protein
MATLQEAPYKPEGCTCPPDVNIWGKDICAVCRDYRDACDEAEALITYCKVCDGAHDGGEFGELCPANGRHWFEPSDPRDLYDAEDRF